MREIKLTITARSEAEAYRYCSLIYEGKEYSFEDFSKSFDKRSLEEMLKDCIIKYRGTEYTLKQIEEGILNFSKEVNIPVWCENVYPLQSMIMMKIGKDYHYYLGSKQLEILCNGIRRARYWLLRSRQIILGNYEINWGSGYFGHYHFRASYFESAILWYNACIDYIYQIIWFFFRLYEYHPKYKNKSRIDYDELLKMCDIRLIYKKIKSSDDEKSIRLLKVLNNYSNRFFELRDWANKLKHRGNLEIKGLKPPDLYSFEILSQYEKIFFSSEDIEPKFIDLDEGISKLKIIHDSILKFAEEIIEIVDFEGFLKRKV